MPKLPPIGMRMVKTAIAVVICLLLGHWLRQPPPLFACMAAVIVMKENVRASWAQAVARILSTVVGCICALVIMHFDFSSEYLHILAAGAGCVITIYFCVLIRHPDAAALSALIFLSLALQHVDDKFQFAMLRMTETSVGIIVAILVNALIKPPKQDQGQTRLPR